MDQQTLFALPHKTVIGVQRQKAIAALEKEALNLHERIDHLRRPMTQRMTGKRARELESRIKEARKLIFYQSLLFRVADAYRHDTLPLSLQGITYPMQVYQLAFHCGGFPDLQKYYGMAYVTDFMLDADLATPERLKTAYFDLMSLADPLAVEYPPEDQLRLLELDLVGYDIPGYYPTPPELVEEMLFLANLTRGMSVLEPSAGRGDIADGIRNHWAEPELTVIELQYRLRKILEAKGYELAGVDFLEYTGQHDVILMNPPFENGEDMQHIQHAFNHCLKPDGRIVAICSAGVFFRKGKKYQAFRKWLELQDHEVRELEAGTFDWGDRPTKVRANLLIIDNVQ